VIGRSTDVVIEFGKYKGRDIQDIPLTYLQWLKSTMIVDLREYSDEIRRREEMGLTPEVESRLEQLPVWVRQNLMQRLARCTDDGERATLLRLIGVKWEEYRTRRASYFGPDWEPERDERDRDDEEDW
jgi:hypothetical protein